MSGTRLELKGILTMRPGDRSPTGRKNKVTFASDARVQTTQRPRRASQEKPSDSRSSVPVAAAVASAATKRVSSRGREKAMEIVAYRRLKKLVLLRNE